ncbi:hypothetical protein ABBQ38_001248, partial [Trebouxia sp. C0009 RCD-2024]
MAQKQPASFDGTLALGQPPASSSTPPAPLSRPSSFPETTSVSELGGAMQLASESVQVQGISAQASRALLRSKGRSGICQTLSWIRLALAVAVNSDCGPCWSSAASDSYSQSWPSPEQPLDFQPPKVASWA